MLDFALCFLESDALLLHGYRVLLHDSQNLFGHVVQHHCFVLLLQSFLSFRSFDIDCPIVVQLLDRFAPITVGAFCTSLFVLP